jgi:cobalt-zinc-cadmium efflux system outer membrane protein
VRAKAEELDAQQALEQATRRRDVQRLALSILLGAERPVALTLVRDFGAASPYLKAALGGGLTPGDEAALLAQALLARPDLLQSRAEQRQTQAQADGETRRSIPLSDLQVMIGARQGPVGVGGLISVSMPLPIFDQNRGQRLRAAAQHDAAQAMLNQRERQIALEVQSALVNLRSAQIALEKQARPLVIARREALLLTQRQFAGGLISLLELITAQRDLQTAQRSLAQAERDAALATWLLALTLAGERVG